MCFTENLFLKSVRWWLEKRRCLKVSGMLAVGLFPGHTYIKWKMRAACIIMHWGGMDCRISIANGPLVATHNVHLIRELGEHEQTSYYVWNVYGEQNNWIKVLNSVCSYLFGTWSQCYLCRSCYHAKQQILSLSKILFLYNLRHGCGIKCRYHLIDFFTAFCCGNLQAGIRLFTLICWHWQAIQWRSSGPETHSSS